MNLKKTCEYVLSKNGSTRGTAYVMSNKIVRTEDKLFFGWQNKPETSLVNSLDLKTGKLGTPFDLGQTAQPDNHCGPALAMTSDGHVHAIVGAHHRPFRYRRTVRPGDISEWTDEVFGPDMTYPSLTVGPDDTLHLTCRAFLPRGEACKLTYLNRPADGEWSQPRVIAMTPSRVDYTHYGNTLLCDATGVLHLTYHCYQVLPEISSPSHLYLQSEDNGKTWRKSDGTIVALPALIDTAECLAHRPAANMRGQGLAIDPAGRIHVLGVSQQGEAFTSLFRLDSPGNWREINLLPVLDTICPGGRCLQEGSITFDGEGRLYVAMDIRQGDFKWGDPSTESILLVSEDRGETFEHLEVSSLDSQTPNWLTSMERQVGQQPLKSPPAFMYTHGVKGEGCTPPDVTEIRLVTIAL